MATPTLSPAAQEHLLAIAAATLGLETLETRNSDSQDFHDLAGMVDHHRRAA